jgi:uracil-DNA glycosylase family 4
MTAALSQLPEQHVNAALRGCECWRCPLLGAGRGPVMPSLPEDYEFLVVVEAPGTREVQEGKTLIGPSGQEVRRALTEAGANLAKVGFTNTALCMPEGGDFKKYSRQLKKQGLPNPIDCCNPRLQNEIKAAKFVLLMGGASVQGAGLGSTVSVMKVRGTPLILPSGKPALATPHAAFVLRDEGRVMRPIFHADVRKAVRIAYQGSTWKDPWYFVPRTAAEVENFLSAQRARVAIDVETDGKDAWSCNLRRIGIGTDTEVMIYAPLSVKGHYLLSREQISAQTRAIASYFQQMPRGALHNGIAFDSVVLARHGMPLPDDRCADTMVGHQIGPTSELPHSLDFLGSMYTDAPHWKDSFKHSTVKDDAILDRYLSFDIAVTFQAEPYIEGNLVASAQGPIYALDAELFRIGRSMSALGIQVDSRKRWDFAVEYQERAQRLLAEFVAVAGRPVNPNSPPQMRQLLYRDLGLPELDEHMTDSGDPSTDETTLLELLALGVDDRAKKIIQAILGCREAEKILGTYTGHIVNGFLEGGPTVHGDGRMRPTWRPGKRSGRWGSSEPNTQNIVKKLRAMYTAAPGNVLVAADMSAVELRMIALLANDEPLIQAFHAFDTGTGPDVHIKNACDVFNTTADKVDDNVRRFVKCVAAGSRVPIPGRGMRRIEELLAPAAVLTEEGTRAASEWHDVGETDCLTIRTDRGIALTVAKRHRVKLQSGAWRWAEDLRTGDALQFILPECAASDYVRMCINPWATRPRKKVGSVELPYDLPNMPEITIDENMGYILGTALGDGGVTGAGTYVVGLLADGTIHETKRCAQSLGLPTYYQRRKAPVDDQGEFGRLNIYSATWRRFLGRIGLHNGRRKVLRVPDVIFHSPKSVIIAFLAGMFDTDGTVGELNVCSKSAEFVSDIALLFAMLGFHGRYEEAWNRTYQRYYYRLRLHRHTVRQFIAIGGMRAQGKLARQLACMEEWGNRAQPPEQVAKVVRVEPAGKQRVYDLTVPSTNSYVANCLVNHNSFVYALSYDAQPPKIYQTLSLLRDDELRPLFPSITLPHIQHTYELWWKLHPAIPAWKNRLIRSWRATGFIETQFHKRRRYFIGGEKAEEMGNHPVQGSSADLQNDSMREVVRAYPFDFARHRGLIVNGHDQIVVECGETEAEDVKQIIGKAMQKRIGAMLFPAKPISGPNWKAVS